MPAKRTSSVKPPAKAASPSPKEAPAARKSAAAALSDVTADLPPAVAPARASAAVEKKKATGVRAGFFEEAERVYDKSTTRLLNDLAGFIVIFVGMIYFTLSGYFIYRETYGIATAAAANATAGTH